MVSLYNIKMCQFELRILPARESERWRLPRLGQRSEWQPPLLCTVSGFNMWLGSSDGIYFCSYISMSLSNRYTDSSVKVISSSNQIYILILVILCFEPLLYRFHRFPELSLNFNEKHHKKLLFKLIQSWTELIGRVYLLCEEGDSDKEIYCFLNILFTDCPWLKVLSHN